ncbi:hypothetical protein EAX61_12950 [Dokdonia sinensis]|uniref:Uncharacterized protein n=1 Tax=Dokdonia sinensis TaxID=2479847 RepID=A0A3M0GI73_9FLAO|nr:hypothetical protein [Dokdonia sinensis]RMB56966.1 hypothetical protein EAX61_12950 [Dokdonia sinensis]
MTTYSHLSQEFSKNSLGYSSLGILLSTCLGSIAIMTTLMHGHSFLQMLLVFLTVVVCSIHNGSIITVQKPSLIFGLLTISTVVNVLIILGNLIF